MSKFANLQGKPSEGKRSPLPMPKLDIDDLQKAGIKLSTFMLQALIAIIAMYFLWGAWGYYNAGKSSVVAFLDSLQTKTFTVEQITQLAQFATDEHTRIKDRQKAFLEMWLESAKLILQLILVPIITAILGYTFGSNSNNSTGSES